MLWDGEYPIGICIQPPSGPHVHPADTDHHANLAVATLSGAGRSRRKRLDPDGELAQSGDVAHASFDHNADPSVGEGECCELVSEEGNLDGPATIDDENAPLALLLQSATHEAVVFEAFHSLDLAVERLDSAVVTKRKISHRDPFGMSVTNVGGCRDVIRCHCCEPRPAVS